MATIPDILLQGRTYLIGGARNWTTREIGCLDWFSFNSFLGEDDLLRDNHIVTSGYGEQFWSTTPYRHQRYDYGKLLFF